MNIDRDKELYSQIEDLRSQLEGEYDKVSHRDRMIKDMAEEIKALRMLLEAARERRDSLLRGTAEFRGEMRAFLEASEDSSPTRMKTPLDRAFRNEATRLLDKWWPARVRT